MHVCLACLLAPCITLGASRPATERIAQDPAAVHDLGSRDVQAALASVRAARRGSRRPTSQPATVAEAPELEAAAVQADAFASESPPPAVASWFTPPEDASDGEAKGSTGHGQKKLRKLRK